MKKLLPEHEVFLKEYEPIILKKVTGSAIKCSQERRDCCQYVRIELLKAYANRLKYAEWDNVVRAVITRRIKDYVGKVMRSPAATGSFVNAQHGYTAYGEQLVTYYDESDNPSGWDLDSYDNPVEREERLAHLKDVWNQICDHDEELTDWEVHYLFTLEKLSESSSIPDNSADIVREMGYRASKTVIEQYEENVQTLRDKLRGWSISL